MKRNIVGFVLQHFHVSFSAHKFLSQSFDFSSLLLQHDLQSILHGNSWAPASYTGKLSALLDLSTEEKDILLFVIIIWLKNNSKCNP